MARTNRDRRDRPLMRKRTRRTIGRRDPGSRGAPRNCRDHGNTAGLRKTKLPCGGTKCVFTGRGRSTDRPHVRTRCRLITDKRHFAGVKAADTRLRNQVHGLMARLRRTLQSQSRKLREGWRCVGVLRALEQLTELREFIDRYFGWEE